MDYMYKYKYAIAYLYIGSVVGGDHSAPLSVPMWYFLWLSQISFCSGLYVRFLIVCQVCKTSGILVFSAIVLCLVLVREQGPTQ